MTVQVLEGLVSALESHPESAVSDIEVLPAPERDHVISGLNATSVSYPSDLCIHELFEAQASGNGDAVAVVFEDTTVSYGELNGRANRLAHYLRGLGVVADGRVGICVERSVEMVTGLLAILKAGGAYVPLDPGYPSDRLAYMIGDSAPEVILSHGAAREALEAALAGSGHTALVLDLEGDAGLWADMPAGNPARDAVGL